MNKRIRSGLLFGLLTLAIGALPFIDASGQDGISPPTIAGQSQTLLPDGHLLLLGGVNKSRALTKAALWDLQTAQGSRLANGLLFARAWHTATVLPDGSVAIIGGVGSSGKAVASAERFDPETQRFSAIAPAGLLRRSHHTATLLGDGTVLIVGGVSEKALTLGDAQLWDPHTNKVVSITPGLAVPRSGHVARLIAGGDVLVEGGVDAKGHAVKAAETYHSASHTFSLNRQAETNSEAQPETSSTPGLASSIPAANATGVATDTIISLQFSEPMQIQSLNEANITLTGPTGTLDATVVGAESGMLVFINPDSELAPSTQYTVTVDGAVARDGSDMAKISFHFITGSTGGTSGGGGSGGSGSSGNDSGSTATVWTPTSDWRTHLPPSPWQSLAPLMAPSGVTALSGQLLTIDGNPLANVTLQVGPHKALSDGTGRFLIQGIQAGKGVLLIDATTANSNGRVFGTYQVSVEISAQVTNILPFTSWMPVLDMAHAATVPSPTTKAIVVTNPLMPGLELHIPAGTIITDINGKVVQTVSMTPVPLDRTPFPLPAGVDVPIYFTVQPGGAQLWSGAGKWAWAQLYYPNSSHLGPGIRFDFWNYEADGDGWYVYGHGNVNAGGSEIIPDPSVGFWEFSGAMVGSPGEPPTTGPGQGNGADPIDSSTGLFRRTETDLHLSDVIPIDVGRTYLSQYPTARAFGTGWTSNYDIYITAIGAPSCNGGASLYTTVDLVLPDGQKVHYVNTYSSCTNWTTANFVATRSSDPSFYGSVITWNFSNNNGWLLRLKNGTVYSFLANGNTPATSALVSITDRYGNQLAITRDSNGNITQITSPNGRWVSFTIVNNRVTQATDNIGRTVQYTYDTCGSGFLCSVKQADNTTPAYSYFTTGNTDPACVGATGNLCKVIDPNAHTFIKNAYDANGRVATQTLADGTSTYPIAYTLSGNTVTQTSITDPNSNVEQKSFDSDGYVTTDIYAKGSAVAQSYSYTRDPNTKLTTAMTDALGRQFSYSYDTFQMNDYLGNSMTLTHANLLSVTCSNCLSQSITTSMTYDPTFNQITSVTDPLTHQWTLGRDSLSNLTSITDPLNHQMTLGYNFMGQLTSITDAAPAHDTATFTYSYGDLASITDPMGNMIRRFTDSGGRTLSQEDILGNITAYTYDGLDRVTKITDAQGNATQFTYDAAGNLTQVKDANNNQTNYNYDSRNRVITRKDALLKTDTYMYDGSSNITQDTDRRGKVTTFQYDALNRGTFAGFGTVSGHKGNTYESTITYTWDAGNRITKAVDSDPLAGTINRTWDGLDRLMQEVTPQGTINYTYDNASRRATMQVVGRSQVVYTWDNANRLTGIAQGTSSVGINYDNANRRTSLTLPNGVTMAYSVDSDSRITGITYTAGSTNLGNLTYTYAANGMRTTTGGSLAVVTLPANVVGGTSTVYNADNAQTKFSGTSHVFDAAGNMTSDGTNTYTFDGRNHLTAISGGTSASFVYDGFGRRMKKVIAGTTTQFLYDGLNPVQEQNSSTGVANLLTGLGIDEFFTRTDSSNNMSTLLPDVLGSTIGLVGSSQTIATSYTYQPFGAATLGGAANGNSYEFAGRENDGTGLYFNRARYYSPTFQRFAAQDPLGFGGGDANLYAYVWNAPASFNDPAGLLGGVGVTGSASGEIGNGNVGAGGSVSGGYGVFYGSQEGFNTGGYASAGGYAGGPTYDSQISYPDTGQVGTAVGGDIGPISGGFFVTNASNNGELQGPFDTLTLAVNTPGFGVALQIGCSNGTCIGSLTAGPGYGIGGSRYATNSWPWHIHWPWSKPNC